LVFIEKFFGAFRPSFNTVFSFREKLPLLREVGSISDIKIKKLLGLKWPFIEY